jgi:hypothetical protein
MCVGRCSTPRGRKKDIGLDPIDAFSARGMKRLVYEEEWHSWMCRMSVWASKEGRLLIRFAGRGSEESWQIVGLRLDDLTAEEVRDVEGNWLPQCVRKAWADFQVDFPAM